MKYDFDEIIARNGTDCVKWDGYKKEWGRDDLLPMWVADMDFKTPPFVMDAIRKVLDQKILGYTFGCGQWYRNIISWQERRHQWNISREELIFIPGIVRGIAFAEQALTAPGDKIMVTPPVYHPFFLVSLNNDRQVVYSPLNLDLSGSDSEQYSIDFERFSHDIKGCRMFILSNPHNPGGRVWTKDELSRMADICFDNGVLVISDEIHSDLTFAPYKHVPFATVSEKAAMNSITFVAPTKAFNLPGVFTSYAVVKNPQIRERFLKYLDASELDCGNIFAYHACASCYTPEGEVWLSQVLEYIRGNIDFTQRYLQDNVPGVGMIRPQASYLIFLDCRKLGLAQKDLVTFFTDKAHLALNDGEMFGEQGRGFMRLNVACPRSVLQKALSQLREAVLSCK